MKNYLWLLVASMLALGLTVHAHNDELVLEQFNPTESVPQQPPGQLLNRKDDGYRGIWYMNQPSGDEYIYKYSGGLGTYCAKHKPFAVYCQQVDKTFFCYGGTTKESNRRLLHMVSYFDHKSKKVPRPTILLDKNTSDAHDNPVISVDDHGYIWIFSTSHGTSRPSYIHRSKQPYNIDQFERVNATRLDNDRRVPITNFSYMQAWHVPGRGFICFLTRYGDPAARTICCMTSRDGVSWSETHRLGTIDQGHYQVSGVGRKRAGSAFNFHPNGKGLNWRTNLYYIETRDFGKTWRAANGTRLNVPLKQVLNSGLVHDYRSKGLNVYLKDIRYDKHDRPVILYLTSKGYQAGPANAPRTWTTARWTGDAWEIRPAMTSDNNYDMGSLWIDSDGSWRIIAPTETGPQPYNPGGEVAAWSSSDQGQTWRKTQQLTSGSDRNHTYVRRPLHADPEFLALWADGHGRKPSLSKLYFANEQGEVHCLPSTMASDFAEPQLAVPVTPEASQVFPKHRFVTHPDAQDMWPCFSPDSQTLLFTRTSHRTSSKLFTISVNGGEPSPFPANAPASGTRANWSTKHDIIAFNGQPPNGRFNLSLINGDGSDFRLIQGEGISNQMSYPSWDPDGMSVAVVDFSLDNGSAIKRIDIETGSTVTLTDSETHWAGVARVSPDGSHIVMGGQTRQGQRYSQYQNQIWFLNRDGAMRSLDSQRGWAPCWSPDGKWILFASDRGSNQGQWAIFIASPDGATVRQLTPFELNAGHPTWSPDGKSIAFFAQHSADTKTRGLAILDADAAISLIRPKPKKEDLDQFFNPPSEYANDFGDYRSPLEFYDGRPVKTREDWQARRQEILGRWHTIMGKWPKLVEKPKIEYIDKSHRENFTQYQVKVEIAPGFMYHAILLVPDGKGPFPAAVVPFYWSESGAGLREDSADFGYQLTRRGFVTLSIGMLSSWYYPDKEKPALQPLSALAYGAANCHTSLANLPYVDASRIGIVGHSYGGKWAMFASCLYDKFACAAWSDGGIVFDENRANVNYWEAWYLGFEAGTKQRQAGIPNKSNPRTGAYKTLVEQGRNLHELHALMAPRPFLVSGGSEDRPQQWKALNHTIAVNKLLGYNDRVAMTNRKGHRPTAKSNDQIYLFFEHVLQSDAIDGAAAKR